MVRRVRVRVRVRVGAKVGVNSCCGVDSPPKVAITTEVLVLSHTAPRRAT